MKKFIATAVCAFMIGVFAITASAEGGLPDSTGPTTIETVAPVTEAIVSEEVTSATVDIPDTDEPVIESVAPETDSESPEQEAPDFKITAQTVADYIKAHLEEISVVVTLIGTVFINAKKHGILNKSITTLNNNSVTVAENSASSIKESLVNMQSVANIVMGYKDEIANMLAEVRRNDEERVKLEASLSEVADYLKATRMANVELANEVAELLVLANIPNSKKDELYARHLKAVSTIAEAEKAVEQATEVKDNEEGNKA